MQPILRRIADVRRRAFPKVTWQVTVLALLLCAVVLACGIVYKVSQYQIKDDSSEQPQVKLLPETEESAKRALAPLATSAGLAAMLVWLAATSLQGPSRFFAGVVSTSSRQPRKQHFWIAALFLRPPPSLL